MVENLGAQANFAAQVKALVANIEQVVFGKHETVKLCVTGLLARGHILIEDVPGIGKTTIAQSIARSIDCSFSRIQFTNDMLPADILGVSILDPKTNNFTFRHGPIFASVILADEVNRTPPKTQSALLEAMEEGQVTIEGETRILPEPFFVIATQNPAYQIGTFPLPESQLDRFLMRIELGYPDVQAERALLEGEDRREVLARLPVCLTPAQLHEAQARVGHIHVAPPLLDYVQALLAFSRQSNRFRGGLSPRAGLGLLRAARAWALLHRRGHVLPEDVQTVLPAVVSHRLHPGEDNLEQSASDLVGRLRDAVALPV